MKWMRNLVANKKGGESNDRKNTYFYGLRNAE